MERTRRPPGRSVRLLADQVSILVVMERTRRHAALLSLFFSSLNCFNPCCDGTDSSTRVLSQVCEPAASRFNPCCDGTDSSTPRPVAGRSRAGCFNPCCDGTDSSTSFVPRLHARDLPVSILVVMERTRRRSRHRWTATSKMVSILVVMERPRRRATSGAGFRPQWSFNPCCDGSDSSTCRSTRDVDRHSRHVFQSLL